MVSANRSTADKRDDCPPMQCIRSITAVDTQLKGGERVRLDAAVAHLVDIDEEIERQTDRMKLLQQEIIRIILIVADADRRILLTLVYIEGKTLRQAASVMNFSYRQVKRIHHRALYDVAVILSQDTRDFDSGDV